jgi:hypothetical protein
MVECHVVLPIAELLVFAGTLKKKKKTITTNNNNNDNGENGSWTGQCHR